MLLNSARYCCVISFCGWKEGMNKESKMEWGARLLSIHIVCEVSGNMCILEYLIYDNNIHRRNEFTLLCSIVLHSNVSLFALPFHSFYTVSIHAQIIVVPVQCFRYFQRSSIKCKSNSIKIIIIMLLMQLRIRCGCPWCLVPLFHLKLFNIVNWKWSLSASF